MTMIFNSIRWRLQIWYGLILLAVLTGFGITAYQLERNTVFRRVDEELQRRAGFLANAVRQPGRNRGQQNDGPQGPPFDGPPVDAQPFDRPPDGPEPRQPPPMPREFHLPPQQARAFDEESTNGYFYVIWRRDGQQLAHSANAPSDIAIPVREGPQRPGDAPGPRPLEESGTYREAAVFTPPGEIVLTGHSIAPELKELHITALRLTAVGTAIFLLGILGGWWLVSRAVRPIADISTAAVKISSGDLSQRINVAETESELGRLATVLNSTFARLDTAFTQQRQFTSDAAHELRTPVSVMLTQAQTTLNRERSTAEYREAIESCERAAQRMRRLIESLLELAKLDAGQQPMKRLQFDLGQTARDCAALVGPLAEQRHVKISCDVSTLNCMGDSDRLSQVVTNLVTNAINYNKENGEVRIAGLTKNGSVILTVTDTGMGIAAEDLPHVFDRFYRADKSRPSGNTGLGLAISKAIVEAHGGVLEVSSVPQLGSVFTIRLPTAQS
jgi:two-component system, OmpR family, sensor kinase